MDAQTYRELSGSESLIASVDRMNKDGYRLAQACVAGKDKFEILYSFEKDNELVNLRLRIGEDDTIESVTGIYPYAYLYENEMKDLFGVRIQHINVDFKGTLYKTAAVAEARAAGGDGKEKRV